VDVNAAIRGAIVDAALSEVSARARDLIQAGCAPSEVAEGMRAAAEILVDERVAIAMLNFQSDAALDAYVKHADDHSSALEARAAYGAARSIAERDAALAKLIGMANRGALRRHSVRLGRVLSAFGIAFGAMHRSARNRASRTRSARSSAIADRADPDGEPPHATSFAGAV
jgi:hypothetical protein